VRIAHAITAALVAVTIAGATPISKTSGPYAAGAVDLWEEMWTGVKDGADPSGSGHAIEVTSPDGKKSITASYADKQEAVLLKIRVPSFDTTVNIGPGVQSAVEWSPDSKAFFVTTSDDGANGWYHTLVFLVGGKSVTEIDPTPVVLTSFGQPVKCEVPEAPNVGAITWISGSKRILIAAEIIHHSNCDSFGTFKAYEVSLPELKIVRTYDQLEAKKLFHYSLGWEIKDAPDSCIRDPKSCWLPGNHESHP
jgi:hypothetical protein